MLKISTGLYGNLSTFFTQTFHSNFTAHWQSKTSCYLRVNEQIKLKRAKRCQFKEIENYMHFNFVKRQLWHQMMPIFSNLMEFDSNPIQKGELFSIYIDRALHEQTGTICVYVYISRLLFEIWIKLIHGSNCMTSKWQQVSSWCCVYVPVYLARWQNGLIRSPTGEIGGDFMGHLHISLCFPVTVSCPHFTLRPPKKWLRDM